MGIRVDPAPLKDREPLEWLRGQLVYGRSVGSWIPVGFERHARILHPAHFWDGAPDQTVARAVPWREVSAWSGKPLHRASSIHDVASRADGTSWRRQGTSLPLEGELEPPYISRLSEILVEATTTPNAVWLLVWHGYAGPGARYSLARGRPIRSPRLSKEPDRAPVVRISPSLSGSGREYFLHRGSIEASSDDHDHSVSEEPPSFWWPADRAWFVSTDIDSSSTYVGGSSRLIERLLDDDLLEVLPASLDDPYDGRPYDPESRVAE